MPSRYTKARAASSRRSSSRLCYRNLFYTGVTRGRKLCIVVGRRDVVNRMMSNIRQNLRYSGLAALLAQALLPEQENL